MRGGGDGGEIVPPTMDQHLQGLRGLAIALVVAFHLEIGPFSGGALGVDVFFVISGFVITRSLLAERSRHGRIRLAEFFARRVRRLVPVSTVVLISTFAVLFVVWDPATAHALREQAVMASIGATNIWSALNLVDYGGPDATFSPFSHIWSLAVEEQFYLVLAPAFAVLVRLRRSPVEPLLAVTVAAAAGSYALSMVYGSGPRPAFAFYFLEARAWELLVGVLLALTPSLASKSPAAWRTPAGWIGIALIGIAAVSDPPLDGRQATGSLLAVGGAALVVMAGPGAGLGATARVLSIRPLTALGTIAYPLYLWHWPVLVTMRQFEARIPMLELCVVAVSISLAWATHVVVEQRVRWWPALVARPWTTIVAGVSASVLVAGIAVVATPSPFPVNRPHRPGEVTTFLPSDLVPSLQSVYRQDLPTEPPCSMVTYPSGVDLCTYGDAEGAKTVAVIGDSHAEHWLPALAIAGRERGWRIVIKWHGGCSWIDLNDESVEKDHAMCDAARASMAQAIIDAHPDLTLLAAAYDGDAGATSSQLSTAVAGQIDRYSPRTPALVLGDVPAPGPKWTRCLLAHQTSVSKCDLDRSDAIARPTERAVEIGARLGGAAYRSTVSWVCPSARCSLIRGNLLVYRDDDHLAEPFARTLAPQIAEPIAAMLQDAHPD